MASTYRLTPADVTDAPSIANLFALSWTTPFSRLQYGNAPETDLVSTMTSRIEQDEENLERLYMVMREAESGRGEVVSVAMWTLPKIDSDPGPSDEEEIGLKGEEKDGDESNNAKRMEEQEEKEKEKYYKTLPTSFNRALIWEFHSKLSILRKDAIAGRRHYLLENLATHPDHRGHELAKQLISWAQRRADKEGAIVYLDTTKDGKALPLYEKLGFKLVGEATIEDLSNFGGSGSHTHVGMVYEPKKEESR